ncbi:hypothetical protein CDL12_26899 [Handroanthus impetiginosus]|uniref:Uncharacterized protein n=1 Tax=Handroanthus impetiginosus TaxID=429701 RepID=A0A2G9G5K3_9LAMI|nr:hypothetical protein CDL12_26899 [Handroanthus impetiginosus]
MRPWVLISLLLLSILVHGAQGRARKLVMNQISSTTAIPKKDKHEETKAHPKLEGSSTNKKVATKDENLSVNSSSTTEQRKTYPDILDIAGMDYSQAKRKPPIHN